MKSSKMFRGYGFIENGIYPDDFFSYPELLYIDNFSHMARQWDCPETYTKMK